MRPSVASIPPGRPTAAASPTPRPCATICAPSSSTRRRRARATQVTDGMSDARYAVFDRSGKYLYFTASHRRRPVHRLARHVELPAPVTRSVYVVVLERPPSPLAPRERRGEATEQGRKGIRQNGKDEDKNGQEAGEASEGEDRLRGHRPAHPRPARPAAQLRGLYAGKEGQIIFLRSAARRRGGGDFKAQTSSIASTSTAQDREARSTACARLRGLRRTARRCSCARARLAGHRRPTSAPPKPARRGPEARRLRGPGRPARPSGGRCTARSGASSATSSTTPASTASTSRRPERATQPYLDGIGQPQRSERPASTRCSARSPSATCSWAAATPRGAAGARTACSAPTTIANGRYRFARIYNGENWNPNLQAPLTQPGVNVKTGEYLLAVNGRELQASTDDIYQLLRGHGRQADGPAGGPEAPTASGSREVTVVPVAERGRPAPPAPGWRTTAARSTS